MIYFDASYLVRLYYGDRGFEEVRHLATTDNLACAQHGQAEVIAAFHRKYREGSLSGTVYRSVLQQFADDIRADAFTWLPLSPAILERVRVKFETLPVKNSFTHPMHSTLQSQAKMGFVSFTPMTETC